MKLGNNSYIVEYLDSVKNEDIPRLTASARKLVKKAIEERLMADPIGFGKPLRYSLKGHRRLRVSDFRVIYRIDERLHKVIIIAIKHRKEIYQDY
jgi:mRNA interferase RelE/StbE